MQKTHRFTSRLAGLAFSAGALFGAMSVCAAAYPDKPIRLIVPYAAGGGTDIAARMLAQKLTARLGQAVVVENKPGAATQIGTAYVARAAADGYTLLMGTANLATNRALYATLPYDTDRDLTPVILATDVPVYLLTPAKSDIVDIKTLRAAASKAGALSFATAGLGSIPHLAGEMFALDTKIPLRHIPYKGSAEALTSLVGGQVPLSFDNLPPVYAQIKAGRIIPIAIAAQARNPSLPEVPTLTELGVPLIASSWWGVMAPAATPAPIVATLNQHFNAVLADPEVRQYFIEQGMSPVGGTPADFGRHIAAETERWKTVVQQAGLKIEQ